ncbi:WD40/YVTN/BNR-like repeat-containing protein [Arthrobacter crystallopoietes]|uniref:BNR/Asp-box repeat-containing protein n=1 Tax=Crystallibacter crystallopoietes TaxID=37928 RepID=A0A1H1FZ16_9MICC|nr:hypothetical protein [Arthrobacter crystallopoietes]SDR06155.1 BNR/Asp-box repeat-containing protein [Arthrobacter crystallopoietes]
MNDTSRTPAAPAEKQKKDSAGRRRRVAAAVAAAVIAVGGGIGLFAATGGKDAATEASGAATSPYVGGDLHILTSLEGRLYVGGHDGGAVSTDGGVTWTQLPSLKGADPMGAAATGEVTLIGGHPGLYRSTDGTSFAKVSGGGALDDVHGLGGSGEIFYASTAEGGLQVSDDGGKNWTTRNTEIGQSFMGVILVDPADPQRLIATDMANGLVTSNDGGRTWEGLGGPGGPMAVTWDPTNTARLVVSGMAESAISSDGGETWAPLTAPEGTTATTFSPDGKTLFAAVRNGTNASVYASTDEGRSWTSLV